jgi:gamma-aminobutyric acid type B receptor
MAFGLDCALDCHLRKSAASSISSCVLLRLQGSVAFNEDTGDRIAWTKIEQVQRGKYEVVAFYDMKSDNLSWIEPPPYVLNRKNKVIWLGDKVPQDRTIIKHTLRMVNIWLYISMVTLSIIGCIFAMVFIWFNFKYAHRR